MLDLLLLHPPTRLSNQHQHGGRCTCQKTQAKPSLSPELKPKPNLKPATHTKPKEGRLFSLPIPSPSLPPLPLPHCRHIIHSYTLLSCLSVRLLSSFLDSPFTLSRLPDHTHYFCISCFLLITVATPCTTTARPQPILPLLFRQLLAALVSTSRYLHTFDTFYNTQASRQTSQTRSSLLHIPPSDWIYRQRLYC